MVLHDGIIKLDYNPATDILETSMPNVAHFTLWEIAACLETIVANVRDYHIEKLLLDTSNSIVEVDEDDEAYKAITTNFAMGLMGTRLKKIARVESTDLKREARAADASQNALPSIDFKNFSSRAEARKWLLS